VQREEYYVLALHMVGKKKKKQISIMSNYKIRSMKKKITFSTGHKMNILALKYFGLWLTLY